MTTMLGQFTKEWIRNQGLVSTTREVLVDIDNMEIAQFSEDIWFDGDINTIGDINAVECEREYVYLPDIDQYHSACRADLINSKYDEYGNGLITYGV